MNISFYTNFGILTCAFADLEANIRIFISNLVFGDSEIIASAFLDNSQFSNNIKILKKISRQYWNEQKIFGEILKRMEKLRSTRNLFIHGHWDPFTFGKGNGKARVLDLKTSFNSDEDERTWNHGEVHEFSEDDFQSILTEINSLVEELQQLWQLIGDDEPLLCKKPGGVTVCSKPIEFTINLKESAAEDILNQIFITPKDSDGRD
ncbi:MAG: hypothetical protein AAFW84_00690 [Cyanobacteria bacterium J06635_15]